MSESKTFADHMIDKSQYGVYQEKGFWKACLFYAWPQHVSILQELPLGKSKTQKRMLDKLNKYFEDENLPQELTITVLK